MTSSQNGEEPIDEEDFKIPLRTEGQNEVGRRGKKKFLGREEEFGQKYLCSMLYIDGKIVKKNGIL